MPIAQPNQRPNGSSGLSRRTRTVWGALVVAMAGVGGLLMAFEGGPSPRLDGLTLTPLLARTGSSSVEAVLQTREPLDAPRWQSIVIHHSDSEFGTPASVGAEHTARNLRGLGYHFLIGNGRGLDDGQVHVGYRWLDQLPGAHTGGTEADWYNRHSIGICLIGDGDRGGFTQVQLERLVQLVRTLATDLDIPAERIVLHGDVAAVSDPGKLFPSAAFREQIADLR